MLDGFLSMYKPGYPAAIVYMLQSTEYQPWPYLHWYWRTPNYSQVMHRRVLDNTKAARLLLFAVRAGMASQLLAGIVLIILAPLVHLPLLYWLGAAGIVAAPLVWAHLVVVPLLLGRAFITAPRERRQIKQSRDIFASQPGVKIAVAGSYGKTSMKELLVTVLSEGKKVAATPANKNVAASHALFAAGLSGDEDIIIIEYGEGGPGDVARFADTTKPGLGIITGLAPAHLDHYPTLEAAGDDIFSLAQAVGDDQIYVNGESEAAQAFIKPGQHIYDSHGAGGWQVSKPKINYDGTSFELKKGTRHLKLRSGLLGRHQIGPLSLAAVLGMELGLSDKQVMVGIAKTQPYEHRMQPRHVGGAWIIDDTYNGNIDGIRAGLRLLQDLPAKRKTYVTPGLVDQGVETERIHIQMGELIADATPDKVVLMENSAARFIQKGLEKAAYKGEVRVEADPLTFYTNIDHFLAAGDLVVMQNDWTDNYA